MLRYPQKKKKIGATEKGGIEIEDWETSAHVYLGFKKI